MSKRSWLPTRKGTELFPGATHIPAVLRIKDVKPGTELYAAIANEYDGQIKQFHAKAQHAHALSPNPITKMRARFGDEASATYTNIQGQETIELEVSRSRTTSRNKTSSDFWDYALVELVMPTVFSAKQGQTMYCYAHMTAPEETPLTVDSEWPVDGVASNFLARPDRDPIINSAFSEAAISLPIFVTTGDPAVASFTVGLQQSRGGVVTLDLYAYLYVVDETLPGVVLEFASTVNIIASQIGNPTVPDAKPPFPDPFFGIIPPFVQSDEPNPVFDRNSMSWLIPNSGTDHWVSDIGYRWSGNIPAHTGPNTSGATQHFDGQLSDDFMIGGTIQKEHWYHLWKALTIPGGYTPGYSGPNPAPAKLNITLFRGVPKLAALSAVADSTYDRWGTPSGGAISPTNIMDVSLPAFSNSTFPSSDSRLVNFGGIPKLGGLLLDTRRIPPGHPEELFNVAFNKA